MELNETITNTSNSLNQNETENISEEKDNSDKNGISVSVKPRKKFINTVWCAILFAIILFILSIGIQAVAGFVGMIGPASKIMAEVGGDMDAYLTEINSFIQNSNYLTTVQTVSVILSLVLSLIAYYFGFVRRDIKKKRFENVLPKICNPNSIFFIICGTIAVMSLVSVLSILSRFMFPKMDDMLNQVMDVSFGDNLAVAMFLVAFLAPISEELLVRGILIRHTANTFGLAGCMILTTVFFSLYHMNPIQSIYVIPMGLFWGFLAYKFKSVVPGIICHMINNFASGYLNMTIGTEMKKIWIYLIIFVVFAAVTILLGKNNKVLNDGKLKRNGEKRNDN